MLSRWSIAISEARQHTAGAALGKGVRCGGISMDALAEPSTLTVRSKSALDRIENLYLSVLRAALLIVATIVLICAVAWAG
jgi:hypothetical protein